LLLTKSYAETNANGVTQEAKQEVGFFRGVSTSPEIIVNV